jgi:hypothetical protein
MSIVRAVARLDPRDADVLVAFTLGEIAMDCDEMATIAEAEQVAKALPGLRRALVRKFVQRRVDGEDVADLVQAAAELTLAERDVVAKFGPQRVWRESDIRRDERGRFSREFSASRAKIPHQSMTSDNWGPGNMAALAASGVPAADLDRYAEDWARLHGEVSQLQDTGAIGDSPVAVKIRNKTNGRVFEQEATDPSEMQWMPGVQQPVGYAWQGGSPAGLGAAGQRPTFANLGAALNARPATERPNDLRYQQAGIAGQAARQLTTPGTVPHAVGTLASVVGEFGPQAEEALGPRMRRTAYRYRGNEVRPDPGVARAVESVDEVPLILSDQLPVGADPSVTTSPKALQGNTPAQSAVAMYDQEFDGNAERIQMHGRSDQAVIELVDDIPTPEQYALGLESGTPPPSTGVVIDSQGRVAHQAVGYEGDHYLPFNLRNLKALSGGQYVRTRGTGGPTSEDIYTGLMGNARMITVASRNGVFTLEFNPETRGSKRYSDKARRMVRRYEQLLDTVSTSAGGRLRRTPVPEETLDRIKQRAWTRSNGNPADYQAIVDAETAKEQFKLDQGIGVDKTKIRQQAEQDLQGGYTGASWSKLSNATREGMIAERMRVIQDEQGALGGSYRLNGPGYASALDALQRQFPDLIRRTSYRTVKEFGSDFGMGPQFAAVQQPSRGAGDKGYVLPGSNKPHQAMVGWWNTDIQRGTAGVRGDKLPVAGTRHNKQRGTWAEPGLSRRRPEAEAEQPAVRTSGTGIGAGGAGGAGGGAGAPRPGSPGTPGSTQVSPTGLAAALMGRATQAIPLIGQMMPVYTRITSITPTPDNVDIVPVDPPDKPPVAQMSVREVQELDTAVKAKWMMENINLGADDPRLKEALRSPRMVDGLTTWMRSVSHRLRSQPGFGQAIGVSSPDRVANELDNSIKEIEEMASQSEPLRGGDPMTADPRVGDMIRPIVTPGVDALPPDLDALDTYVDDAPAEVKDFMHSMDDPAEAKRIVAEHTRQGQRIKALKDWQAGAQSAYPVASGLGPDDFRALGLTATQGPLGRDDMEDVVANAKTLASALRSGPDAIASLPDIGGQLHPLVDHQRRAEGMSLWAARKALEGEPIPKVSKGLGRGPVPLRPVGTSFRSLGPQSGPRARVRKQSQVRVHQPDSPLARAVARLV